MINPVPPVGYETAAARVFKKVSLAIAAERVQDWDFAIGVSLIDKLLAFLRDNRDDLGNLSFRFELRQSEFTSGKVLTPRSLLEINSGEPKVIVIDRDLRVITAFPLVLDPNTAPAVTLCQMSKDIVIAEYENASIVNFYANKCLVGIENPRALGSLPPRLSRFAHRGQDYELAVRDHYRQRVKYNWLETDHWEDRHSRTLRRKLGSKGTERIFHNSLFLWLYDHLEARVRTEPKSAESDEPDIEIGAIGGGYFVIEVKWLGDNSKTTYSRPQLVKAIGQVNSYLKKQTDVNRATLVVYDGRNRADFDGLTDTEPLEDGCVELQECDGAQLIARGSCLALFLENKTASE